ncbi:MAG: hypothetical protein AAF388_29870, partial [Bacteroidota bacterium]
MKFFQGHPFRADVAFAIDIVLMPFDGENLIILDFYFQATHGLTEVTGSVFGSSHGVVGQFCS